MMCLKGSHESCVLLERMTKVETKQAFIMLIVVVMFVAVMYMSFKMLNAQIYLLTGDSGLRTISAESRGDIKAVRDAQDGAAKGGAL